MKVYRCLESPETAMEENLRCLSRLAGYPELYFFKVSANMTVYNRKTQKILESVVQSELYEASRILFVRKENKNNEFIKQFVLCASPGRHFGEYQLDENCTLFYVSRTKPTLNV